ncbi:hypothetical protein LOAG_04095 [Loa loa]|uniref:Uncharacterized protein n=1 Tax=Loa loa TaxID=7209 RepID=A0A1S0U352_LOALO|nr:hypothetical protein LOAG_04095 [Loa loa]EFO24388.1 hypothetical protein LOAG_04095 [Loa loa]
MGHKGMSLEYTKAACHFVFLGQLFLHLSLILICIFTSLNLFQQMSSIESFDATTFCFCPSLLLFIIQGNCENDVFEVIPFIVLLLRPQAIHAKMMFMLWMRLYLYEGGSLCTYKCLSNMNKMPSGGIREI